MAVIQSAGELERLGSTSSIESALGRSSSLRLFNDLVLEYDLLWRSQPMLRTVTDFIARNLAQLGVHLYRRVSETDRERVRDHPFVETMRRPNPADRRSTTYRLVYGLVLNLAVYDVAFLSFVRAGDRIALVRLPSKKMQIRGTNWLWPDGYRLQGSRGYRDFEPGELAHFQGSESLDDPRFGESPIESLRQLLAEEQAAGEYREQFWRSGARISGWVQRPATAPSWKPESRDRFRDDLAELYTGQGARAGGIPILEDGMTFQEAHVTARDMEWLAGRKLTREECAAAYHIHPAFVGILENANFANMREQHRSLYQDSLGPWVTMLEQDLTMQVLPEFDDDPDLYVKLNIREKLRGDFVEEARAISTLVGRPILSANEGRALLERNDVPEGEGLVLPLNVVVGGQASPTDVPGRPPADGAASLELARRRRLRALMHGAARKAATIGRNEDVADLVSASHLARLSSFFERQRQEVLSEHGANPVADLEDLFDRQRWDEELGADLAELSLEAVGLFAGAWADGEGIDPAELDLSALDSLALVNASIAASNINGATAEAIAEGFLEADTERADAIRHVFEIAVGARAAQIATTRTTWTAGAGTVEAARQSNRRTKTWITTSANARESHALVDGETVGIGELFSLGGAWPGDPAMGSSETAGCTCTLVFNE